ncbi:hypothetical protein N7513_003683 [Penicillium frequentans]|nr:hypothetical protein N7513_003683 [Penicillium glabrum]
MPASSKEDYQKMTPPCVEKRQNVIQGRQGPACLPCQQRKIRCVGQGTPCETCVFRRMENMCELATETRRYPDKIASDEMSPARDMDGLLSIRDEPGDTTGSPSTASTVSVLSELSQTPSVVFSDSGENIDVSRKPDGVTFEQLLDTLPTWKMIDRLKTRYFEFVFPLFCTFSSVQFEDEYAIFRQNRDLAPLTWLSLLFAILALACRAEQVPENAHHFDTLSTRYEKAGWNCLSINNPPFEPSKAALKALILIIYSRVHRGEDVSSDLQTAYGMATSTDCQRCSTQPMTCEEHETLWTALKVLLFMNGQLYCDSPNQEVSRNLYQTADINWRDRFEMQKPSMSLESSPLSEIGFTMLQFRILMISDTINMSTKHGLSSSWSLSGVVSELARIENDCNHFCASQGEFCEGRLGILRFSIQFLRQTAHLPFIESYLDGDTTSDTRFAAETCIDSATWALEMFCLLIGDKHFNAYSWYMRGFGKHCAMICMTTLRRGLETIRTGDRARKARYYLDRVAGEFSTPEK